MKKWADSFNHPKSLVSWQIIWETVAKTSRCVTYKENIYKIIMHWYKTLTLLHTINPSIPATGWRCLTETGSLEHIFWSCP